MFFVVKYRILYFHQLLILHYNLKDKYGILSLRESLIQSLPFLFILNVLCDFASMYIKFFQLSMAFNIAISFIR